MPSRAKTRNGGIAASTNEDAASGDPVSRGGSAFFRWVSGEDALRGTFKNKLAHATMAVRELLDALPVSPCPTPHSSAPLSRRYAAISAYCLACGVSLCA